MRTMGGNRKLRDSDPVIVVSRNMKSAKFFSAAVVSKAMTLQTLKSTKLPVRHSSRDIQKVGAVTATEKLGIFHGHTQRVWEMVSWID